MKILIFYTPRSKSTAAHNALAQKFNLEPFSDRVTKSRILNQNFSEYPELFEHINNSADICVKLNGNDFIDLANQQISDLYTTIDYSTFDHIIFTTRSNLTDAVASYAYMDPSNSNSWHQRRGEIRIGRPFVIPESKMFYLLRGYLVWAQIRDYISAQAKQVHSYEYDHLEQSIARDFGVDLHNDTDIIPNEYNYSELASNYAEIHQVIGSVKQRMQTDINYFWSNRV